MPRSREERIAGLRALETADFDTIPLRHLEVRWIDATCLYEALDDGVLSDGCWDRLTRYLRTHGKKLSPYFRECIPMACLRSSTGSGIDWTRGIPKLAHDALKE